MRWIVVAIVVAVALPACRRVNTDESAELSVARARALVTQHKEPLLLNDLTALSDEAAGTLAKQNGSLVLNGLEISNLHAVGRFVNGEMVKAGLAWRYEEHDQQNEFGTLEEEARTSRRGLWVDAHPVPPWEWREKKAVR